MKLTAIVPPSWPKACKSDPNACSILLRIDYCASSVLFTGDAEADEEPLVIDQLAHADLLQVGASRQQHIDHGSVPGQGHADVRRHLGREAE